jgi:leucine-rich repeat protein SHOC2
MFERSPVSPENTSDYFPRQASIMASQQVLELIAAAHRERATKLDLSGQNLTELPESVCKIDSLLELDLSHNQLIRLPDSIGNLTKLIYLNLRSNYLNVLPHSIDNLRKLKVIVIHKNPLINLPDNIGNLTQLTRLRVDSDASQRTNLKLLPESIGNLVNLTYLQINDYQLLDLPMSMNKLKRLSQLYLINNNLAIFPPVICCLNGLTHLSLKGNRLVSLPENIERLSKLKNLDVSENQITELPKSMSKLTNLFKLDLNGNQITDLSILQALPKLKHVNFMSTENLPRRYWAKFSEWKSEWILDEGSHGVRSVMIEQLGIDRIFADLANIFAPDELSLYLQTTGSIAGISKLTHLKISWMFNVSLPHRYWRKFSDWKAKWLLDENNTEIRRRLIEQLGYEKICDELGAIAIDTWQEYTLLKIDNIEIVYQGWRREMSREPMMLLKMTCPSTAHIHILRVPPEMTGAEEAIVWVNHGIHPSKFAIQT